MDFTVTESYGAATIAVNGVIHQEEAAHLKGALEDIIRRHNKIAFDLSGVSSMDSSGIGYLLSIQRELQQGAGCISVTGLCGKVRKLFELANLSQVMDIRT